MAMDGKNSHSTATAQPTAEAGTANCEEMNNSKRKRVNSNGDEETDYQKKISELEEQTQELGRTVEQLKRQAKS
uniref:Uncharacterized protein n=1 Tax=Romanomermis culicivorax TaxID=13658 RepID=A0A915I389_ROMCU